MSQVVLGVLHDASWIFYKPDKRVQPSFVKQFINTYLGIDGSRFTERSGYSTLPFWEESFKSGFTIATNHTDG